jgi:hypothetical protein
MSSTDRTRVSSASQERQPNAEDEAGRSPTNPFRKGLG